MTVNVAADELRAELNAWFLRQTDSKLRTYVSIMALVENVCLEFPTKCRPQIVGHGEPEKLQLDEMANSKRRNEAVIDQSTMRPPLKRVKREAIDSY